MDPVQKIWMMNNWQADQNEQAELAKNHAYLLGSFWNPEAVKQLAGDSNTHMSNDEEYEESLRIVKEGSLKLYDQVNKLDPAPKRRRRRPEIKQG